MGRDTMNNESPDLPVGAVLAIIFVTFLVFMLLMAGCCSSTKSEDARIETEMEYGVWQ